MKLSLFLLTTCLAAAIFLAGCSKNNGSPTGPTVDANAAAVQSIAIHSDSLNQFDQSDSVALNDQGAQAEEYDNSGASKVESPISPLMYGRKLLWSQSVRTYATVMIGDTAAVVTVTRTVPGVFYVVSQDSITLADTTYTKSFTESINRSFYFKRIARRVTADSNWIPVAVSIGYGYSAPVSNLDFKIVSVEFSGPYDTLASDPLHTWFLLGHPLYSGIPFVHVGDSVRVTVWVASSDSQAEIVHLRHGISVFATGSMRVKMYLAKDSLVAGGHVRAYTRAVVVHSFDVTHVFDFVRRYCAIIDVASHATIWDSSAPVENEYWSFPYIAYK